MDWLEAVSRMNTRTAVLALAAVFLPVCYSYDVQAKPSFLDTVRELLDSRMMPYPPELHPQTPPPAHRAWASLLASMPGGGQLVIELPEYINAQDENLPLGQHESALISGRKSIHARTRVFPETRWQPVGAELVLDVSTEQGISVCYRVRSTTGSIDITCIVENGQNQALRRVNEFICCSPSRDSPFFTTDVLTTRFFCGGKYVSWDRLVDLETLWRPGRGPNQTVQWLEAPVRGSGRILNPHRRRAVVSGEVDMGLIVQKTRLESDAYMILLAEPAISIFKNCAGGCIHANPAHGDIPPGATHEARLVILFVRGEDIQARLEEGYRRIGGSPADKSDYPSPE